MWFFFDITHAPTAIYFLPMFPGIQFFYFFILWLLAHTAPPPPTLAVITHSVEHSVVLSPFVMWTRRLTSVLYLLSLITRPSYYSPHKSFRFHFFVARCFSVGRRLVLVNNKIMFSTSSEFQWRIKYVFGGLVNGCDERFSRKVHEWPHRMVLGLSSDASKWVSERTLW